MHGLTTAGTPWDPDLRGVLMTIKVYQVRVDRLLHGSRGPLGVQLQTAGINVQSRAKRFCPVDTGRLRSSIVTTKPTHTSATEITVRIGSRVKYSRFVELGTRFMRARPYLRPALAIEVGRAAHFG